MPQGEGRDVVRGDPMDVGSLVDSHDQLDRAHRRYSYFGSPGRRVHPVSPRT